MPRYGAERAARRCALIDMGAGHDHGSADASTSRLRWALVLTGGFLIAEVVGALMFNSLALLSDAAHMFTDTTALAIALAAVHIGRRPADDRRTFGYRRFEVLAAAFNALLLFAVAAFICFESAQRLLAPEPVQPIGMLVVAVCGLLVNVVALRILAAGRDTSLNIKGAYLEVWADALGSVGVIVAALLIYTSGWSWVDPLIAIALALWVLPRTFALLRDTLHVLLQGVPQGTDLSAIREALCDLDGVVEVHDLHLWSLTGNDGSLSAHLSLGPDIDGDEVRQRAVAVLEQRFGLHHVTLQTERTPCADREQAHR